MTEPLGSELEAAHQRIEQLESEHAERLAGLRAENAKLKSRLVEVAPSRTKTGRTFFAVAMLSLTLSLALGMIIAHMSSRPAPARPTTLQPEVIHAGPPFDGDAASRALATTHVESCGGHVSGHVWVTFSPSGIATSASVAPPLAGTPVGACLEQRFRGARIPAFSGEARAIRQDFVLP